MRISSQEKQLLLEALRAIFLREYVIAIDALRVERRLATKKSSLPYLSGFCPMYLSAKRIRVCSVVRRFLFTEAEIWWTGLTSGQVAAWLQKFPPELRSVTSHTYNEAVDQLCDVLLPNFTCGCKRRPSLEEAEEDVQVRTTGKKPSRRAACGDLL